MKVARTMAGWRWAVVAFVTLVASAALAETAVVQERFSNEPRLLPDGERRTYPDPRIWAFTFWPGMRWPESYGDGTNWLAANFESQVYTSAFLSKIKGSEIPREARYDPFSIADDGLHIRAAVMTAEQQRYYQVGGHRRFGSGLLMSRDAFEISKIRMVAKLPGSRGTWPALWLLPSDHTWPPEIDVFEAMPWGKRADQIHTNVIPSPSDNAKADQGGWTRVKPPLANTFHEYGLNWNDDSLEFIFDGNVIRKADIPASLRGRKMHVLVNLAVGGKWVYNELGILPIDDGSEARLAAGSAAIESDYPAEMVIKSLDISVRNNHH